MDVVHHVVEQLLRLSFILSRRNHWRKGINHVAYAGEAELAWFQIRFLRRHAGHRAYEIVSEHTDVDILGHHLRRGRAERSEEHTSELQSLAYLVCRLLLEKKK